MTGWKCSPHRDPLKPSVEPRGEYESVFSQRLLRQLCRSVVVREREGLRKEVLAVQRGWAGDRKRELGFQKRRGCLAREQGDSGNKPATGQFCLSQPGTDVD